MTDLVPPVEEIDFKDILSDLLYDLYKGEEVFISSLAERELDAMEFDFEDGGGCFDHRPIDAVLKELVQETSDSDMLGFRRCSTRRVELYVKVISKMAETGRTMTLRDFVPLLLEVTKNPDARTEMAGDDVFLVGTFDQGSSGSSEYRVKLA